MLGRPLSVTDSAGHTTTFTYDGRGRLTSSTNEAGAVTQTQYDPVTGQVSKVILPPSVPGGQCGYILYSYAYPGGPVSGTTQYNEQGQPVQTNTTKFGMAGEKLGTTSPSQQVTTTYDGAYRTKSMTDKAGSTTQYNYANGLPFQTTYPGGEYIRNTSFDEHGRLQAQQRFDANNVLKGTTTFGYDAASRLQSIQRADGVSITYGYDLAGRRASISDGSGNHTESYDDTDNVLMETTAFTDHLTQPYSVSYTYNPDHTRASMQVTGLQNSFTYSYDGMGRLLSVTNPRGETSTWTYSADNLTTTRTLANGASTTTVTNVLGQLTGMTNYDHLGVIRAQFSGLAYDGASHRTAVTGAVANRADCSGVRAFSYTNNQLHGETFTPQQGVPLIRTYSYDANGNIDKIPGHEVPGYEGLSRYYNSNNQWVGYNTTPLDDLFRYDDHGNPTHYKGYHLTFDAGDPDGEVAAIEAGAHAEPTVLHLAQNMGWNPKAIAVTTNFCPTCREFIINSGGTITGPRTAIW